MKKAEIIAKFKELVRGMRQKYRIEQDIRDMERILDENRNYGWKFAYYHGLGENVYAKGKDGKRRKYRRVFFSYTGFWRLSSSGSAPPVVFVVYDLDAEVKA